MRRIGFTTKDHEDARSLAADWLYHEGARRGTKPCGEACLGSRGFLYAGSVDSFVREGPLRAAKTMRRIYLRERPKGH